MKIFICFTPLHVLIAQRIIDKESIKEYIYIYFTDIDTEKNKYYYNKLSENAIKSSYIVLKKNIIYDLNIIFSLYKSIKPFIKNKLISYYTGKVKSSHVRLLMFLTNYSNLITFDDGSGNISGSGYFYDENESMLFKLFFLLFKKELLYKNIKYNNLKHYTIFDLPNVFKCKILLNLFDTDKIISHNKNENITILLTNAFAEDGEMKLDDEMKLYENIIDKYNVSHILKHPREQYKKIASQKIEELKSMKIAEELIYELNLEYNVIFSFLL